LLKNAKKVDLNSFTHAKVNKFATQNEEVLEGIRGFKSDL
jgi:hypothetical protein